MHRDASDSAEIDEDHCGQQETEELTTLTHGAHHFRDVALEKASEKIVCQRTASISDAGLCLLV